MLLREDTEAYTWLLTSFMTAHEKQPTMVVTDQDRAMKRAMEAVLTESTHRLCMIVAPAEKEAGTAATATKQEARNTAMEQLTTAS
ncbi:FAR1-related sequence 5-like protein [Tanacetum coccineum]